MLLWINHVWVVCWNWWTTLLLQNYICCCRDKLCVLQGYRFISRFDFRTFEKIDLAKASISHFRELSCITTLASVTKNRRKTVHPNIEYRLATASLRAKGSTYSHLYSWVLTLDERKGGARANTRGCACFVDHNHWFFVFLWVHPHPLRCE